MIRKRQRLLAVALLHCIFESSGKSSHYVVTPTFALKKLAEYPQNKAQQDAVTSSGIVLSCCLNNSQSRGGSVSNHLINRAFYTPATPIQYMGIDHRGVNIGMTQKLLNGTNIIATL